MNENKTITILYVEDDMEIQDEISFFLENTPYTIVTANNGLEGIEAFQDNTIDLIVTDVQMPKMDGLTMVEEIKKVDKDVPIIITSAFNENEKLLKAINLGVTGYLIKPINLKQLIEKIEYLLRPVILKYKLELSNSKLDTLNKSLEQKVDERTAELESYKERLELAFAGSNDGIWDWNIKTDEVYLSPRWKEIIGYEDDEIANHIDSWTNSVCIDDFERVDKAVKNLLANKKSRYNCEFRQKYKDGGLVWVHSRAIVKYDENNNPVRMIGTHTDISLEKRLKARLEEMSFYDNLTGAANRLLFFDRVAQAIRLNKRENHSFSLMSVDINDFKTLNDKYGHEVGDHVLITFCNRIKKLLRENDTVARMGGDEFIILLENTKGMNSSIVVAENIIKSLESKIDIGKSLIPISCSIGISQYPQDGSDVNSLVQKSDEAMHTARDSQEDYKFFSI